MAHSSFHRVFHLLILYTQRLVAGLLIAYGIYSLYTSIKLIIIDIPQLEQQLTSHRVNQNQINALAADAIFQIVNTVLSFIFAAKLTVSNVKFIDLILGIGVLVGSFWLNSLLLRMGGIQYLQSYLYALLHT